MNAIIDNDFKMASILLKSSKGIIFKLLKQFETKQVLLLQKSFSDHPCETILINSKTDLLELLKYTFNEFDLLIIDNLNVDAKSKKILKFIKSISKFDNLDNKQIILLFNSNDCSKNIGIKSFGCYKRAVLTSSDKIYTISADNHHYFLNELTTNQTKVFRHY